MSIPNSLNILFSEEELKHVIATKDVDGDGWVRLNWFGDCHLSLIYFSMISIKEFMGEAEEDPVKKKAELAFDIIDK